MHAPSPDHFLPPETARPRYRWALHRFACFCAGSILFLICLGGLVTSHEAGMSVPDWPNTYGYNMFFFPWQDWVGGIFYEHSHRLVAFGVGVADHDPGRLALLSGTDLAALDGRASCRSSSRSKATLGGLRVVLSEDQLGIFHGCLAQLLFVSVSLIALFTSRWWIEARRRGRITPPQMDRARAGHLRR